jgi:sugar phosphate isomerase/epimerase
LSNLRRVMWNGTVRALPLAEQLHATQLAGCEALTLTPSDYVTWLAHSISTRDMCAMAADAGVAITHLDPLVRWTDAWRPELPGDEAFPVDIVGFDLDDFFSMAGALEVQSFIAWAGFARGRYTRAQIVDAFGNLCRRAAIEGLRCDLEFMPVFGIPDLQTAWDIISQVGAPNSGIVLDLWHYVRSGLDPALLSTIPGECITAVQLCDASLTLPAGTSLAADGLTNRQMPGDGEFPIADILATLQATGGLNNCGIELFSPHNDRLSADAIGSACK